MRPEDAAPLDLDALSYGLGHCREIEDLRNTVGDVRKHRLFQVQRAVWNRLVSRPDAHESVIQDVGVHVGETGQEIPAAGIDASAVVRSGRIASLYVNDFNAVARATYARIGFTQVGTFATVLLD